jgi:hypothetical protein
MLFRPLALIYKGPVAIFLAALNASLAYFFSSLSGEEHE